MKKKQSINEISAFIGITLFVSIIAFTIVTNIPVKEVEKEFKPFTQSELDDFWKLDNIETNSGRIIEKEQRYSMHILRNMVSFGTLRFKTKIRNTKKEPLLFEKFKIECCVDNESDSILMKKIGGLILKYQISYITTRSYNGDFTAIRLKDGRKVFLIKKDANIIDNYHKELIEKASFINDSTKVILPLAAKKIYYKHTEVIDGIRVKKK